MRRQIIGGTTQTPSVPSHWPTGSWQNSPIPQSQAGSPVSPVSPVSPLLEPLLLEPSEPLVPSLPPLESRLVPPLEPPLDSVPLDDPSDEVDVAVEVVVSVVDESVAVTEVDEPVPEDSPVPLELVVAESGSSAHATPRSARVKPREIAEIRWAGCTFAMVVRARVRARANLASGRLTDDRRR